MRQVHSSQTKEQSQCVLNGIVILYSRFCCERASDKERKKERERRRRRRKREIPWTLSMNNVDQYISD